jgi:hypothetical protein
MEVSYSTLYSKLKLLAFLETTKEASNVFFAILRMGQIFGGYLF